MPRIKTEHLLEGMKVVTDVKNVHDMLLIPAGCELSERQIGILQAWGVEEVEVQHSEATEASDPVARLSAEDRAGLEAEIQQRFWEPDASSPIFFELNRLLLERRARKGTAR
jgi:hypothetical protein